MTGPRTIPFGARTALATLTAAALAAVTACGSGFSDGAAPAQQTEGSAALRMLITSNGPEDAALVQEVASAWGAATGNTVDVQVASDMGQQLAQGFAAGSPPDVFMVDASQLVDYAAVGNLHAYGDDVAYRDDILPGLADTFTYDGALQCVPKDSSNLGLVINNEMWAAAGLTDADVPTTWDELEAVATRLTTDGVTGLAIGDTRDRVGAFLVQNGGWFTDADQTTMTTDTPQNLEALQFVQRMLAAGVAAYPSRIDSGWGGEAIGKGTAAMTVEGNWFAGAAESDYPDLDYRVVELPAGPTGTMGTLSFTQCWGVAAASPFQAAAVDLVGALMEPDAQLRFAEQFGVMPALSSLSAEYAQRFPDDVAWLAGNDYARGTVNARGLDAVMKDFDTKLQGLPGADPAQILAETQATGTQVIEANR